MSISVNLLKVSGNSKKGASKTSAKSTVKLSAKSNAASNGTGHLATKHALAAAKKLASLPAYLNERFTDFSDEKEKKIYNAALDKARQAMGKEYPSLVGLEKVYRKDKLVSINPSKHAETVGVFQKNTPADAVKAIEAASVAFEEWKQTTAVERATFLLKAAALMRKRKHEFSAVMTMEVAKNWAEADADTAEAIDFMEFYAREALRYAAPQPVVPSPKWMHETNELFYVPMGVVAVLPPWNFPLAILVGMTTAALVTGNTVVLKPSPDAMLIAYRFFELMEEIKLPKGVLSFLTGGADVGETMVTHPKTRVVAFTGSKAVGLRINELAAKTPPEQKWIKRVIAEMGGKDAIIVDREADLDAAASGTVAAAFGFSGQKCSACSRVIIDEKVYDRFLDLLIQKASQVDFGDAAKNPDMSAVSSERSFKKIIEYIEVGRSEGRLIFGGSASSESGYYIQPTIFADVAPTARLAQEEIFGPVLACIKAKDFDDAIRIANNTEYGLTGGVFTKNKKKLERAKEEFFVGNLYLNRKCTGALVGVHPFGGFNLSGTDSKAGGRDYLLFFLQAKSIANRNI